MVSALWLLLGLSSSLLPGSWAEDQAPETDAEDDSLAVRLALCPPKAVVYKTYCYQVFENTVDWYDAELQCQFSVQGHLASFLTLEEERFVSKYIKKKGIVGTTWIGLHAEHIDGQLTWSWSDNSLYSSITGLWDGRRPEPSACDENCLALSNIASPKEKNRWLQYDCYDLHFFVCKFQAKAGRSTWIDARGPPLQAREEDSVRPQA